MLRIASPDGIGSGEALEMRPFLTLEDSPSILTAPVQSCSGKVIVSPEIYALGPTLTMPGTSAHKQLAHFSWEYTTHREEFFHY